MVDIPQTAVVYDFRLLALVFGFSALHNDR